MKFVLASSSPRRYELLGQINIVPDQVLGADIDETQLKQENPRSYVKRIAGSKMQKLEKSLDDAIILTCDTIVAAGNKILHKACSDEDVRKYLTLLSGRRHRVYSSICVVRKEQGKIIYKNDKMVLSIVKFKRLDYKEIEDYVLSKEGVGKAGGYAIQGLASSFIPWISGSYSNIVGLPIYETRNLLKAAGYGRSFTV